MMSGKAEIFLSYCWADIKTADNIFDSLTANQNVNLHRDAIDIGTWESIKEYMQSIPNMDYTILLISDSYLKSGNCMYEVLEVMRNHNYKNRIFPAIINKGIYDPVIRANYVKYWQQQYSELKESLQGIEIQNLGRLGADLKRRQDISSNIAAFLDFVADMNNPGIDNVCTAIERQLADHNMISVPDGRPVATGSEVDLFAAMNIPKRSSAVEITDLEISQFMSGCFRQIHGLLEQLCKLHQEVHSQHHITIEQIDSRNYFYQFYINGKSINSLKLFLDSSFGMNNIGISNNNMSFSTGNHSWNGMYTAKVTDGKLMLTATMSIYGNREAMTVEDVVKDIWINYIQRYLER